MNNGITVSGRAYAKDIVPGQTPIIGAVAESEGLSENGLLVSARDRPPMPAIVFRSRCDSHTR
jgi:hypothetical protein